MVEVADDRYLARIGRPDGEVGAGDAVLCHWMSAEFVVDALVVAFPEEVEVVVGKKRGHGVMNAYEGDSPGFDGLLLGFARFILQMRVLMQGRIPCSRR
jgi:hypothetical protein